MTYLKQKPALLYIITALLFSFTSCTKDNTLVIPDETLVIIEENKMALEIHQRINAYRVSKEISPLIFEQASSKIAMEYAAAMSSAKGLSEEQLDILEIDMEETVNAVEIEKNLNKGHNSADSLVEAWITEKTYLSDIVSDSTLTGIGAVSNEDREYVFIQVFYKK